MNSNTSSTGRERRDRPGFGWAGRSAALALWIISVLLWCVLMRQSFNAMPWDEMTVAGTRLHEWRKPFAAAGMAVGVIGTGVCLGCLFWLCLSSLTGAGWGITLRRVLAAPAGQYPFLPVSQNPGSLRSTALPSQRQPLRTGRHLRHHQIRPGPPLQENRIPGAGHGRRRDGIGTDLRRTIREQHGHFHPCTPCVVRHRKEDPSLVGPP